MKSRKIISVILTVAMVIAIMPMFSIMTYAAEAVHCEDAQCSGVYENGFCTKCGGYEEPDYYGGAYQIDNAGKLFWFANHVNYYEGNYYWYNNECAEIMADLDLGGREWTPILCYEGTIEGNYHTISNFTINTDSLFYVGFISELWGGTIRELGIGGTVTINHSGSDYNEYECTAGTLVGQARDNEYGTASRIVRCFSTADISITGYNSTVFAGGLIGLVENGVEVENCYTLGSMTLTSPKFAKASGFVNSLQDPGSFRSCYAAVSLQADATCAFVGVDFNGMTADNCYCLDSYSNDYNDIVSKSAEEFASGEVAYLLQAAQEEDTLYDEDGNEIGKLWGQIIGIDEYPVLGGAEVIYDGSNYYNDGIAMPILALTNEQVKVALPSDTSATLIVASYEADTNQLVDCKLVDITEATIKLLGGTEENGMRLKYDVGNIVKAFLWENMTTLTPLCEAKSITISE